MALGQVAATGPPPAPVIAKVALCAVAGANAVASLALRRLSYCSRQAAMLIAAASNYLDPRW